MANIKETKILLNEMLIAEWQDTIDMMRFNICRYREEIDLFDGSDDLIDQRVINSRKKMINLAVNNIELAKFKIKELRSPEDEGNECQISSTRVELNCNHVLDNIFLNDEEKAAAEAILNILNEQDLLVKSAATILDVCKELLKYSPIASFRLL